MAVLEQAAPARGSHEAAKLEAALADPGVEGA